MILSNYCLTQITCFHADLRMNLSLILISLIFLQQFEEERFLLTFWCWHTIPVFLLLFWSYSVSITDRTKGQSSSSSKGNFVAAANLFFPPPVCGLTSHLATVQRHMSRCESGVGRILWTILTTDRKRAEEMLLDLYFLYEGNLSFINFLKLNNLQ